MKELGKALNESVSDSEQIADVVSRVKGGGYDIFMVLKASVAVKRQGDKESGKTYVLAPFLATPGPDSIHAGDYARVGPVKPDGTPNPSAGRVGRVRTLLSLDAIPFAPPGPPQTTHAVVEVDHDFILVSLTCLEAL